MENYRVLHHPILRDAPDRQTVTIYYEGRPIEAYMGEPIASALMASGIRVFRNTIGRHEPRGVFCAIGRCTDCMMIVNGQPNVRTCVTPVEDGMSLEFQHGSGQTTEAEVGASAEKDG